MTDPKRILLIDHSDSRRDTRVSVLENSGYKVEVRSGKIEAERLDHEGSFDIVVIALHRDHEALAEYSNMLSKYKPGLPILLLTDHGVFVPRGILSPSVESGNPAELIHEIARMLGESTRIREL